jgi:hypothetical protein
MKKLILIPCMLFLAVIVNAQQTDFPKLTGPYLGQNPPWKTPRMFAPSIISVEENLERSPSVFFSR